MGFKQFLIEARNDVPFHKEELKYFDKVKLTDLQKIEGQLEYRPKTKLIKTNHYLWLKWKVAEYESRLSKIDSRREGLENELNKWRGKKYKKNNLTVMAKNDPDENMYKIGDINDKKKQKTINSIGRSLRDLDDVEKRLRNDLKQNKQAMSMEPIPLDSPDNQFFGKSEKEIEKLRNDELNKVTPDLLDFLGIK